MGLDWHFGLYSKLKATVEIAALTAFACDHIILLDICPQRTASLEFLISLS